MRRTFLTATLSTIILLAACGREGTTPSANNAVNKQSATPEPTVAVKGGNRTPIKITSAAFEEGGMIPAKYTCDGANVSPPLAWSDVPPDAKSLALITDDPDTSHGTWTHWVVYKIPATEKGLPEGVPEGDTLADGARQGTNDPKKTAYSGPCPPDGTHRYFFKLYALDTDLNLASGATKDQLLKAIEGHVVAEGELMGQYKRH